MAVDLPVSHSSGCQHHPAAGARRNRSATSSPPSPTDGTLTAWPPHR